MSDQMAVACALSAMAEEDGSDLRHAGTLLDYMAILGVQFSAGTAAAEAYLGWVAENVKNGWGE